MCPVDEFFDQRTRFNREALLMLKRNKNKKSKGEVTFTLTKVPKSYEEMTAEEKWEWAGKLLEGMKPKDLDKS
jgi:hypothetical protein